MPLGPTDFFGKSSQSAKSSIDLSTSDEEPGIAKQIGGGLLVGARRDPIVGFFVDRAADILPGVAREDLDDLEAQLAGKTLAQAAAFVGEWGPALGIGFGAYAAGRLAGRAALRSVAPRLMAKGPANFFGRQAQQFLTRETVRDTSDAALKAGAVQGAKFLRPGRLERGAEIIGGALGAGFQGGAGTALQGGSPTEIAESFAIAAVLAGGIDGALYGIGRAISPRVRSMGSIDKFGRNTGYDRALEVRAKTAKEGWDVSYPETGRKSDLIGSPTGVPGQVQGEMFDSPNMPFVRMDIRGNAAELQRRQFELEKLLQVERRISDNNTSMQPDLFTSEPVGIPHPAGKGSVAAGTPQQLSLGQAISKKSRRELFEAIRASKYVEGQKRNEVGYVPTGPTKARRALAEAIKNKQEQVGTLRGKVQAKANLIDKAPIEDTYNSQTAYDAGSPLGAIRSAISEWIEKPIGVANRLGVIGKRVINALYTAETRSLILKENYTEKIYDSLGGIAKALKIPVAKKNKSFLEYYDDVLTPFFSTLESDGVEVATRRYGEDAVKLASSLLDDLRELYKPLISLGARPFLEGDELLKRGVKTWLPHVAKYGHKDIKEMFDDMVIGMMKEKKQGGLGVSKLEAEAKAARLLYTDFEEGLRRFGSIDKRRDFSGNLIQQQGVFPMEGYATGLFRYASETARRGEYAKYVGLDGSFKDEIIALARREGADIANLQKLLDHALDQKFYNPAMIAWGRRVINLQAATKLTFATVPNFFQTLVNNSPTLGLKNTLKGMGLRGGPVRKIIDVIPGLSNFVKVVSEADENMIAKAIALNEEYMAATRHINIQAAETRITDRIADVTLRWTGFNVTERMNRMATGIASLYHVRELAGKGIAGKLRGHNLEFARRQFRSAGLDLDKIIIQARSDLRTNPASTLEDAIKKIHGETGLEESIFKLVRDTQFTPTQMHSPKMWQHPLGRVITQFKSFAHNQGILVRDHIIGEAALGNIKPLMMATAMYPATGYMVQQTLDALKDKDKPQTELGRFLSMTASVGGFGLASSVALSAYYGRLGDAVLGPTGTDIGSATQAIILSVLNADAKYVWARVESQPAYQGARLLAKGTALGLGELTDIVDTISKGDISDEFTNFEQLIRDQQAKR